MANLLAKGADLLKSVLLGHCSSEVTYTRGEDSVTLRAVIGRTDAAQQDAGTGVLIASRQRDFLIATEDLVLGGVLTKPEAGDLIEEFIGGVRYTYEVASLPGQPVYERSQHRGMLRVHTKLKGEAVSL